MDVKRTLNGRHVPPGILLCATSTSPVLITKILDNETYRCYVCIPEHVVLMTEDRTPSDHSFVARSNSPYSSPRDTAFGLIGYSYIWKNKLDNRENKS